MPIEIRGPAAGADALSGSFAKTLSALESERRGRWIPVVATLAAVFLAWGIWALVSGVDLLVVSEEARIESRDRAVRLDAPVSGWVTELLVRVGEEVAAGDPLVVLEHEIERLSQREEATRIEPLRGQEESLDRQLAATGARRSAALRASEASLAALDARIAQARSQLDQARAETRRARRLLAEGVASPVDLELTVVRLEVAEAGVTALERERVREEWEARSEQQALAAEIADLEVRLESIRGSRQAGEVAVERLRHEVSRRVLRSPVAGRVGSLALPSPGVRLEEGDRVATLVPTGGLRIEASFSAAEAVGRVAPGQPARMLVDGLPWIHFGTVPARVERVASDPSDGGGRVAVELALEPGPGQAGRLSHGMTGEVRVVVERARPATLLLRAVGKRLDDGS